jgi:GAF domain-containing protein
MKDFQPLLARIGDGLARGLIDQRSAAQYVGAHLARRLYCSRVSLWTLADAPGRAVVTRVGGHDALVGLPQGEVVTVRVDAPSAWLGALFGRGGYASTDTAVDRRLSAQLGSALVPPDVGALLQASIGTDAKVCGFISCEQVGATRAWTPEEARLLRQVADAISQLRAHRHVPAVA